jgi:50S ribosomal protein L16 3-hydroxylase
MQRQTRSILKKIKWDYKDVENFLGIYLSEPKSHIFFEQPEEPLSSRLFLQQVMNNGVRLDLKSRLLSGDGKFFMNGEVYNVGMDAYKLLLNLADSHEIFPVSKIDEETGKILYQWYVSGYLESDDSE